MADRIIIGGFGPAGASLALALVAGGMPAQAITIIDQDITINPADPADMRILALNAGSRTFLEVLGIWPALATSAQPMRRIAISDSALEARFRPALLGFDPPDADTPLAHLVPLGLIQSALRAACQRAGVPLVAGGFKGFSETEAGIEARLGDDVPGKVLKGALLIAADGARSPIRMAAGIPVHGWGYRQRAIVATIRHSAPHEGEAIQHFLPGGPFAMLPLDEGRSSIVWSEREDLAKSILAMDREDQRAEIEKRAAGWRGDVLALEGLSSHPLQLALARRFFKGRIALVADAAHVVHPLAGQGLNLGFADVEVLAGLILERLRLGLDPGAPDMLEAYQAARRPAAAAMAFATDGINRLFSSDFPPLRLARNLGAGLVERIPGMKSRLMGLAAGIRAAR